MACLRQRLGVQRVVVGRDVIRKGVKILQIVWPPLEIPRGISPTSDDRQRQSLASIFCVAVSVPSRDGVPLFMVEARKLAAHFKEFFIAPVYSVAQLQIILVHTTRFTEYRLMKIGVRRILTLVVIYKQCPRQSNGRHVRA